MLGLDVPRERLAPAAHRLGAVGRKARRELRFARRWGCTDTMLANTVCT